MAALITATPIVSRVSPFAGRRVRASCSNGTVAKASGRANWMPGSTIPEYLDGSLPGDYGFDPLGLGKVPTNLARFQEAELMHCRWAMLGTAGCWGVEALGFGTWQEAPLAENQTWFGQEIPFPIGAVIGIEILVMAYIESARANESDPVKRTYPGGAFDPAGLSKDPVEFEKLKRKEIANGRLAMVAFAGILAQSAKTDSMGPVAALAKHVADPYHGSIAEYLLPLPK